MYKHKQLLTEGSSLIQNFELSHKYKIIIIPAHVYLEQKYLMITQQFQQMLCHDNCSKEVV